LKWHGISNSVTIDSKEQTAGMREWRCRQTSFLLFSFSFSFFFFFFFSFFFLSTPSAANKELQVIDSDVTVGVFNLAIYLSVGRLLAAVVWLASEGVGKEGKEGKRKREKERSERWWILHYRESKQTPFSLLLLLLARRRTDWKMIFQTRSSSLPQSRLLQPCSAEEIGKANPTISYIPEADCLSRLDTFSNSIFPFSRRSLLVPFFGYLDSRSALKVKQLASSGGGGAMRG
jgi:hypothetical protein